MRRCRSAVEAGAPRAPQKPSAPVIPGRMAPGATVSDTTAPLSACAVCSFLQVGRCPVPEPYWTRGRRKTYEVRFGMPMPPQRKSLEKLQIYRRKRSDGRGVGRKLIRRNPPVSITTGGHGAVVRSYHLPPSPFPFASRPLPPSPRPRRAWPATPPALPPVRGRSSGKGTGWKSPGAVLRPYR